MGEEEKTGLEEREERKVAADRCDRCGGELEAESGVCPVCDEPAPRWMVYVVYVLVGLFLVGLIYRLIFP